MTLAQQLQPVEVRKTRWRNFSDACSRFGVSSAVIDLAYRAARRIGHLRVVNLVRLNLADLSSAPPLSRALRPRWLTADEVRTYAADPANDLNASMAWRLENGRNYCHAIFDGPRLANYSWFALESIEPEHSLGIGLFFPLDTVYLYKAYTHPDYRGQRIHHAAIASAVSFFGGQGISQLIAVIEYANWASLRSHTRLGCQRIGRILRVGRPPLQFHHYPRVELKLGLQFSRHKADTGSEQ
jgi:GNAT superfamily N-acetyltransferase